VKVGLIGCGSHMSEVLYPALRLRDDIQIVLVCSNNKINAQNFANKWAIPIVCDSWRDINKSLVDAVVCSGPVELHLSVAQELPQREISVFIEKPVATNLVQLKELITQSENFKAVVQVGYNLRFASVVRKVFEDLSGAGPLQVDITYASNKPKLPLWNLKSIEESLFLALAVHPLSMAQSLLGVPTKQSITSTIGLNSNCDIISELSFSAGSSCKIRILNHAENFSLLIKVQTANGKLIEIKQLREVYQLKNGQYSRLSQYDRSPLKLINDFNGYINQMDAFIQFAKQGASAQIYNSDLQDSLWMYELLEQLKTGIGLKNG